MDRILKYFSDNLSTFTAFLFLTLFIVSVQYNFSYFYALSSVRYMTLLDFGDIIEGSFPLIIWCIFPLISYISSFYYLDIIKSDEKFLVKPVYFYNTFFRTLVVISSDALIVLFFIKVADLSKALDEGRYINNLWFFLDILLYFLMRIYFLIQSDRKVGNFIALIFSLIVLSNLLGKYDALSNLIELNKSSSNNEVFIRSINRGVFFVVKDKREILFKPWQSIKEIKISKDYNYYGFLRD